MRWFRLADLNEEGKRQGYGSAGSTLSEETSSTARRNSAELTARCLLLFRRYNTLMPSAWLEQQASKRSAHKSAIGLSGELSDNQK
jgi:hypothetical protein